MKALRTTYRIFAVAVTVWALGVAVYFLFFEKVSFESVTVSASQGEPPVTTRSSGQAPWLSEAGPISVVAMLTFSLLLAVGAAAAGLILCTTLLAIEKLSRRLSRPAA